MCVHVFVCVCGVCVSKPLEVSEVLERLRRRSPLLRRHTCWIKFDTPTENTEMKFVSQHHAKKKQCTVRVADILFSYLLLD